MLIVLNIACGTETIVEGPIVKEAQVDRIIEKEVVRTVEVVKKVPVDKIVTVDRDVIVQVEKLDIVKVEVPVEVPV